MRFLQFWKVILSHCTSFAGNFRLYLSNDHTLLSSDYNERSVKTMNITYSYWTIIRVQEVWMRFTRKNDFIMFYEEHKRDSFSNIHPTFAFRMIAKQRIQETDLQVRNLSLIITWAVISILSIKIIDVAKGSW